MELKHSISIGADYLQNKVKAQYSNHRTAIIREFLQNSIDAGSSLISFRFDPTERTLTVTDNGSGMDDHIMVNYLFQLGGSLKDTIEKSTGGFGAAKLILLFQHEYFKITSYKNGNKYEVNGIADRYSDFMVTPDTSKIGTEITIKFLPTYANEGSYDYFPQFEEDSIKYIQSCEYDCKVTWNDKILSKAIKGQSFRTISWATFYHNPVTDGSNRSNYIKIRINGLTMFHVYIENLKSEITVELSKSSLEILTENRDSLKYYFQQELNAIIGEFNMDKESFARLKGKTITYHGKNGTSFTDYITKTTSQFKKILINKIRMKINQCEQMNWEEKKTQLYILLRKIETNFVESLNDYLSEIWFDTDTDGTTVKLSPENAQKIIEVMKMRVNTMGIDESIISEDELAKMKDDILGSNTNKDFVIKVSKDIKKLPHNMDPEYGISPKYYKLAQIWCHCIKTLCVLCETPITFKIGWVIDDGAEAMYLKQDGDDATFLINPEIKKWWSSESKVNNIKKIARAAAHEFAHGLGKSYHDESFCSTFETILDKMDLITNWKKFESDAYEHEI